MGKDRILLVITPGRQSTEALHWALHQAKETKRTLRIVYIVDEEMADSIQQSLANTGFIGDRPGEELTEALNREYRQRGKKVLEELEKQCRNFGVGFETETKAGNYLEICDEVGSREDVAVMVVTEKKQSFFKKVFEGSETKKLRERVSCEIKSYST